MPLQIEQIRKALEGIVTYQPDSDLMCLAEYAAKVPDNGIIVELGTADGASAIVMALASKPSVKVYTCDPLPPTNMDGVTEKLGLANKIGFTLMTSNDYYGIFPAQPVDLVFIDGMHSYTAVKNDIQKWCTYLKDGSIMLIHDTLLYENTIGVAVKEAFDQKLIKPIKLLTDDLTQKDNVPVGMYVTEKLPWLK